MINNNNKNQESENNSKGPEDVSFEKLIRIRIIYM